MHPDLGKIHFIARAITPPRRPRRFDTRFFTADASAVAHKIEGVVGPDSELVELVWVPIEEATHLDMPTITGVVLEELAARVAAGMGHDLPVPFYFMDRAASSSGNCCKCSKIGAFLTFAASPLGSAPTAAYSDVQFEENPMAKAASLKIKLVSSAGTGHYYVTRKNSRTQTDKLTKKKYDPIAKKHVEYKESKIK